MPTNTLRASANAVTGDVALFVNIDACPPAGAPNASGTVQFFEGSTAVGSFTLSNFRPPPPSTLFPYATLFRSERAQLTLLAVSPGTHTYTAVYSGDTVYAPSTSAAISVIVTARPPLLPSHNYRGATAKEMGTATLQLSGVGPRCRFAPPATSPSVRDPQS